MDDLETTRAAFLQFVQQDNRCVLVKTFGQPCHSHKCGCALEMQTYIDDQRTAYQQSRPR